MSTPHDQIRIIRFNVCASAQCVRFSIETVRAFLTSSSLHLLRTLDDTPRVKCKHTLHYALHAVAAATVRRHQTLSRSTNVTTSSRVVVRLPTASFSVLVVALSFACSAPLLANASAKCECKCTNSGKRSSLCAAVAETVRKWSWLVASSTLQESARTKDARSDVVQVICHTLDRYLRVESRKLL